MREFSGMMEMFCILIEMWVTQIFAFGKTATTIRFRIFVFYQM